MRIERIVQSRHRLALTTPIAAPWEPGPRAHLDVDLIRVESDTGLTGVASGPPLPDLTPYHDLFVGADPLDLERHNRIIESLSFHVGPCWPLDLALWDLAGRIHGRAVWQLLGGTDPALRVYAAVDSRRPAEDLAALAQDVVADGLPAMALRLDDPDWEADLARAGAVREAAETLILLADCGQAAPLPWHPGAARPPEDTRSLIAGLEALQTFWVEDPLHRADYKGMHDLRDETGVNIAGGGTARELHDVRNLIVRNAIDVLRADAARVGGITGLFPLARRAKDRGLMFSPQLGMNGLALMANAHLAAALGSCPCLAYPLEPPGLLPDQRDFLLTEPVLPNEEGWLTLSDAPGFGIEIDWDRAENTRIA